MGFGGLCGCLKCAAGCACWGWHGCCGLLVEFWGPLWLFEVCWWVCLVGFAAWEKWVVGEVAGGFAWWVGGTVVGVVACRRLQGLLGGLLGLCRWAAGGVWWSLWLFDVCCWVCLFGFCMTAVGWWWGLVALVAVGSGLLGVTVWVSSMGEVGWWVRFAGGCLVDWWNSSGCGGMQEAAGVAGGPVGALQVGV